MNYAARLQLITTMAGVNGFVRDIGKRSQQRPQPPPAAGAMRNMGSTPASTAAFAATDNEFHFPRIPIHPLMAQFIFSQCQYSEITNTRLFICRQTTFGGPLCQKHQWAADEVSWLENNINVADVSISEGER
jgi:hypothetical protein